MILVIKLNVYCRLCRFGSEYRYPCAKNTSTKNELIAKVWHVLFKNFYAVDE
jgi:hypothetical protein